MCPEENICIFNHNDCSRLFKKVRLSKLICMHYSNTGLKIASLFLSLLPLPPTPISLSHKWDRGSLDRHSLTLTQALCINWEQSKWLKLVLAVKSHHGMSRHVCKIIPRWAERPRERENTGMILSVSCSTSFISIIFLSPTFNLPPSLLHLVVKTDRVDVTWLQWNVTSRNLLPELIGLHCSGQGC